MHVSPTAPLVVLGLAWALLAADAIAGTRALAALGTVPESPAALGLTLGGWVVLTLAVTGPGITPLARHIAASTVHPARTVTTFVGVHVLVWTLVGTVGGVVLGAAAMLPGLLVPLLSPAVAVAVLPATALALAAGWQLTHLKEAAVDDCRRAVFVPATGPRAERAVAGLAFDRGLASVVAYAPAVGVVLTAPGGHLPWAVALAALIRAEQARGLGRRHAHPTALVLAVVAVGVVVTAAWLTDPSAVVLPRLPPHHR